MRQSPSAASGKRGRLASFTLIELLVVIAIIAILVGLTLAAASGVMKTAARNRARAEIAAISAALESYKVDNGAYPQFTDFGSTNSYSDLPTTVEGPYQDSSQLLYQNLTGLTNYSSVPQAGVKSYITLKKSQLGNDTATSGNNIYIQDPFGNSYGYFTGSTTGTGGATTQNPPYNGSGFFDLWSTAGDISGTNADNSLWINNWSGS